MSFDLLKTHTPITYTMVLQCICFYVSQQGVAFLAQLRLRIFYFEEKNMEKYSLCGEKIAYSREKLQFSKKELAEHMGVSVSTLSKYEKGIFMPSVMPLYILSLIMDMPMETFVSDDFSLEEFKKMSAKITSEMFIELHNDIVKGIF